MQSPRHALTHAAPLQIFLDTFPGNTMYVPEDPNLSVSRQASSVSNFAKRYVYI